MLISDKLIELVRQSGIVDEHWYREKYAAVDVLNISPVEHFLRFGLRLGFRPAPGLVYDKNIVELLCQYSTHDGEYREFIDELLRGTLDQHSGSITSDDKSRRLDSVCAASPSLARPFAKVLALASKNVEQSQEDEVYRTVKSEFDLLYYLYQNVDIANVVDSGFDPVRHYIEAGAREGRNPSPEFSTRFYTNRHPEVKESGLNPFFHYLTIGRKKGLSATPMSAGEPVFDAMSDILKMHPKEAERRLSEYRKDIRARLEGGTLGDMVVKATHIEPLIAQGWRDAVSPVVPPFHSMQVLSKVTAMHKLHCAVGFRRARVVIVVPDGRWGGGARMEGHIARALSDEFGADEILILQADGGAPVELSRFPIGCRHVDFAEICKDLAHDLRMRMLTDFLRALDPIAVFNINSRIFWQTIQQFGNALTNKMDVYPCVFCNDKDVYGAWMGFAAKYFYRCFDKFTALLTDSYFFAQQLKESYCVPPSWEHKVVVLEAPVSTTVAPVPAPPTEGGRRPQVFWAGRFDRQKRIDVVFDLARRMPDVTFRMWGESVLNKLIPTSGVPENVVFEGKYARFSDLPLHECDLWLYTSEWDGVPSMLLEVSMTGVPIVGAIVGGTGEVLLEDYCERIEGFEDVGAYEIAIRRVLVSPQSARTRAKALRDVLSARRTEKAFKKILLDLLEKGK